MKKTAIRLAPLVLLTSIACSTAAGDQSTPQAAADLDQQSQRTLGVHIRALQFLFEAEPGTFLLKDVLVRDGAWDHLQELERAGYVKHSIVKAAEGEFVQIELTAKGHQVRDALAGP
jgi:hypothetical protein